MIRIGPAGWSYKDWEGIVYPAPKPRDFDPVAWLAQYFDTIEINSSYYGPPRPNAAKKWVESVAANLDFRFTAKIYHCFTHERKATPADESDFKAGLAPLADAGRLGALLLQFPWSFRQNSENRAWLTALIRTFREYPLVIEVRHATWAEPEILDFLAELDVGLCNIDQPQFHRSIRPGADATSAVGYVRLHGRNYKQWFSKTAGVRERYDYLYSVEELAPWVDRIREVATRTKDVYAVTNNHNLGKAGANALEIAALLHGAPVAAPPPLVEHYPELKPFTC